MKIVILLLVAYLLGSIPQVFGLVNFSLKRYTPIWEWEYRNNQYISCLRKPAGITVLLMDILKGTLATSLPYLFGLQGVNPLFFGVAAVLGHTFPIFANFKGGKAVATSAGMLLAYSPTFFIYSALIFVICLYLTSMVSLTSMISAVLITLSTIILPFTVPAILPTFNWLLTVIAIALTTFIFVRHRENIQRIKMEQKVVFLLAYV